MGKLRVSVHPHPRRSHLRCFHLRDAASQIGLALLVLASAVIGTSRTAAAQVSLSTVVDLAQRNSTTVRLAEADLQKAIHVYAETTEVYIPNLVLGSSIGPPS